MRYTFDAVEVKNPDEWYVVVRATETATGQQWELLDTVQWMPEADPAQTQAYLDDAQDAEEPGEFWQEW